MMAAFLLNFALLCLLAALVLGALLAWMDRRAMRQREADIDSRRIMEAAIPKRRRP